MFGNRDENIYLAMLIYEEFWTLRDLMISKVNVFKNDMNSNGPTKSRNGSSSGIELGNSLRSGRTNCDRQERNLPGYS